MERFLVQVSKDLGYANITENQRYSNHNWEKKPRDSDHGQVKAGDELFVYCTTNVPGYGATLAFKVLVEGVSSDHFDFTLGERTPFSSSLKREEVLDLVAQNRLPDEFRKCGQQGFNIVKLQQVLTEESLSLIEGREPLIKGREPEEEDNQSEPEIPYSVNDIIADGCFLERSRLEGKANPKRCSQFRQLLRLKLVPNRSQTNCRTPFQYQLASWIPACSGNSCTAAFNSSRCLSSSAGGMRSRLERLRKRKNVILQGPPGTGKTWLAKRLAFALVGRRSERRVRPFQFHPNLSYEDFVRGWRPSGEGKLALVDGPFLQAVEDAGKEPSLDFVVVIEEINRGSPAQIFGEMLTLLEADKRTYQEALALSYSRHVGERIHIPPNLYVIGTMNVADRSLALVDLALRRRFAFINLDPAFGDLWRNWVSERFSVNTSFVADIEQRLTALNESIATDSLLGPQFRVGHSVVTPSGQEEIDDPVSWFRQTVETEIGPLLEEYWFDQPSRAGEEKDKLLQGLSS